MLLLLVTAVVLWAVLQTAGILLGDQVSNQLDERTSTADVGRAVSEIDHGAAQLKLVTADWALWDDTYRFMQDHDPAFARANLTSATFSALDIDFMIFADKTGRIVYEKTIDPVSRRDVPLPAGLSSYLASRLPGLRLPDPHASAAGALQLPAGKVLMAVQPISTSSGREPADGFFVTGYFLSPGRLAALRKRIILPFDLHPIGSRATTPAPVLASRTISGYGVVRGIDGASTLVVGVTQPRTAFAMTRHVVLEGGTVLGIFGLLLVGGLGLTLDAVVLPDHLRALQSQMILDIAREAMDRLRDGLTPDAADEVCRLVLEHSTAAAVAMTDTACVLGFAGVGDDHHTVGSPITTQATRDAIALDSRQVLRSRDEIGCRDPRCPLRAAIIIPLRIGGCSGGTLKFYFTSPRKLNKTAIALADGLGPLLSMRLELDRSRSELAYLAAHDPLTELANRRQFETELKRALSENERLGGAGALLWFDLDRFKDMNDCLGHRAGDDLLVAVAEVLRASSRDYGTLARLGGDEFGMLVPHVDAPEAEATAFRLLTTLADTAFSIAGHEVRVTTSIGLVRFPEHGTGCDELLARADLAMYEAKAGGGNQLVAYAHDDTWQSRTTGHIELAERIVSALHSGGSRASR